MGVPPGGGGLSSVITDDEIELSTVLTCVGHSEILRGGSAPAFLVTVSVTKIMIFEDLFQTPWYLEQHVVCRTMSNVIFVANQNANNRLCRRLKEKFSNYL